MAYSVELNAPLKQAVSNYVWAEGINYAFVVNDVMYTISLLSGYRRMAKDQGINISLVDLCYQMYRSDEDIRTLINAATPYVKFLISHVYQNVLARLDVKVEGEVRGEEIKLEDLKVITLVSVIKRISELVKVKFEQKEDTLNEFLELKINYHTLLLTTNKLRQELDRQIESNNELLEKLKNQGSS